MVDSKFNEKEMNKLEKYKKGDSITVLGYFDNTLVEDDLIYIVIDIDEIISIKFLSMLCFIGSTIK